MTATTKTLVIDNSLTADSRDYIVSILSEIEAIELQQDTRLSWKDVLNKALWTTPSTFHNASFFGNLVLARFNRNTGSVNSGHYHWTELEKIAPGNTNQQRTFAQEVEEVALFLDDARRNADNMIKSIREAFAAAGPGPTQEEVEWSCRNSLYPIGATRQTHIERLLVHLRSKRERGTEQDQTTLDILTLIDTNPTQEASETFSEDTDPCAPKGGRLSQSTMEFLRTQIGLIPRDQLLVYDVALDRAPEEVLLMMLDQSADQPLSHYWDQYKKLSAILMKGFPVHQTTFSPKDIVSLADWKLDDQSLVSTEELERRKNLVAPAVKLREFLQSPSDSQAHLELSAAVELLAEWMTAAQSEKGQ